MNPADLTVFDLESSAPVFADGVKPDKASIIQVAIAYQDKSWSSLVNPGFLVPQETTDLTGITNAMLEDAPRFKDVAKMVAALLRRPILAGFHILRFDVPLLAKEFGAAGIDFPWDQKQLLDFGVLYMKRCPRTLNDAFREYVGGDRVNAHDASVDVRDTQALIAGMAARHQDIADATADALALECNYGMRMADPDRKFAWNGDLLVWNFGKHKGVHVSETPSGYNAWFLDGDFPEASKVLFERYTQGELK